jgi:hypothetical protein
MIVPDLTLSAGALLVRFLAGDLRVLLPSIPPHFHRGSVAELQTKGCGIRPSLARIDG